MKQVKTGARETSKEKAATADHGTKAGAGSAVTAGPPGTPTRQAGQEAANATTMMDRPHSKAGYKTVENSGGKSPGVVWGKHSG